MKSKKLGVFLSATVCLLVLSFLFVCLFGCGYMTEKPKSYMDPCEIPPVDEQKTSVFLLVQCKSLGGLSK